MVKLPVGNNKGMILYFTLAILLIAVISAMIILNLMRSQNRLSHHQISRIQAYYAGLAGINYAWENLAIGNWPLGNRTVPPWTSPALQNDRGFPHTINSVNITVSTRGTNGCDAPPDGTVCISTTVNYTYIPSS
jgi:Tfp pilus assembly protein PilX